MSKIKLVYFDVDGGRGEPIRIALHAANQAFDDERFSFSEFPQVKTRTPFGQVPVVEMDGEMLTQSNALCRYFGRQAGLYPDDAFQAYLCDEAMDVVEDITHKLTGTFGLEGEALKSAREAIANGPIKTGLAWMNKRLEKNGTGYFADGRLTMADLKVYYLTRWIASGMLDHIAPSLVLEGAPLVAQHIERVTGDERVRRYYAGRQA